MSHSYSRPGGGARSLSMRELMDMPFDQLASGVEAAAAVGTSGRGAMAAAAALPRALRPGAGSGGGSGSASPRPLAALHPLQRERARSSSSARPLGLPLAGSEDGAGLMELAHLMLRDAAFHHPFDGGGGAGRAGSSGSHPHRSSRRLPSPRVAPDPADGHFSRLPLLELALAMGQLGRGGGGGGSMFARPQSAAAGSDGGRSGLPYEYEQLLALDEGRMRRVVKPEVIRGLPVRTASRADASQQCNVCLEKFTPARSTITTLPCAHAFCADCIRPWLAANTTCPVCRWAFPERQTVLAAADAATAAGSS